jgi:hypothetical protein
MARKATIKGRGAKILFGEEATPGEKRPQPRKIAGIEIKGPDEGEQARAEAATPEEGELARALEAEAKAATPEKDELARTLEEEAEAAIPGEPLPAEERVTFATPVLEPEEVEPTTLPPSFSPAPIEPEPPAPEPPISPAISFEAPVDEAPRAVPPPSAAILPEPTGDIDLVIKGPLAAKGFFAPSTYDGTGAPVEIEPDKPKFTPRTEEPTLAKEEEDEMVVLRRIGAKRRRELFNEIDLLYDRAAVELSSNEEEANVATRYLSEARDTLMENPRQFDEAEQRVALTKAILMRRSRINRWSYTYGMFIFFWALGWMLIFGLGLIFEGAVARWVHTVITGTAAPANLAMKDVFAPWGTMLMGGIGGVTGILYSLYWHVAMKKDFDRQYTMWYLVQPIMGSVLGAIVYLIFASGFLSIQVITANVSIESVEASMSNSVVLALHWTVGWAAGFRQRFVYELIDRVVQLLTPKPRGVEEEEKEEQPLLRPSGPPTPAPSETVTPMEAAILAAEAAAAAPSSKPSG